VEGARSPRRLSSRLLQNARGAFAQPAPCPCPCPCPRPCPVVCLSDRVGLALAESFRSVRSSLGLFVHKNGCVEIGHGLGHGRAASRLARGRLLFCSSLLGRGSAVGE